MSNYKPRRQSPRWLDEDCPKQVLAIYDNKGKTYDRYTVYYAEPTHGMTYADTYIGYRAMSENPSSLQGFGIYGEITAYDLAMFRYRRSHQAAKWSSLPEAVKRCVREDAK